MDTRTILLDVGGTYIKRYGSTPVPIPSAGTREDISAALNSSIVTLGIPAGGLKHIGVAIPGPFNYKEGVFLMKHKFAAVYGKKFAELAGIPVGVDIKYIHDVAAVLEGAVKMLDLYNGNTALISLGTGLGFCVAVKGKVRYNDLGSPADSAWNLPWKGGILEDFASARGVKRFWAAEGGNPNDSAADIAHKADEGNLAARRAYANVGETLGMALKDTLEGLKVDTLLFSGQVSKSLNLMEENLHKYLKDIYIAPAPAGAVFEGIISLFDNNQH